MSLLLVRHGQASFGAADYDQLSGRGVEQSRRLGDWLADGGHRFDAREAGLAGDELGEAKEATPGRGCDR